MGEKAPEKNKDSAQYRESYLNRNGLNILKMVG